MLPPFKLDKWVQALGPRVRTSLHGSVISPISLRELQQLAPNSSPIDWDVPLTYGSAQGSLVLRTRIAELHSTHDSKLTAENVIITTGSILANYLVLTSVCGAGDHVICQYPTYGQLHIVPRSTGAEVELWKMHAEQNWIPNLDELAALIRPNTKAIILNNPTNPTGTVLPEETLVQILALARKHDLCVVSDEVFTPLFHGPTTAPRCMTLGYAKTVSTGSVSKAQGLAGIRAGWIVSRDYEILERIMTTRDYTTISVSQLDEAVASFALSAEVLPKLMEHNLAVCQRSIALLDDFISRNSQRCRWVRPAGGGTAFIQILDRAGEPVDDREFVTALLDKHGVSVVPAGHCFNEEGIDDFPGYIRITLGEEQKLKEALPLLQKHLDETQ